MTPEEIAQQHGQRPGYTLASYGEIGLPFYKIKMNCLMLEEKEIGAIDEFILKGVSVGIRDLKSLGTVLGLDESILDSRIGELIGGDDLAVRRDVGQRDTVELTAKGRRVLDLASSVIPQEIVIEFDYDGLLRRPIPFVDQWLTPRQLRERGLREVPPSPTRPPRIEEVEIVPLRNILKAVARGRQAKRELLAFRSIERRYICFQPALALVYKADAGGSAQIAFAINGRLSPEHEHAFARALAKNRLAGAINLERTAEDVARELLGDQLVRIADRRRTLLLQKRVVEGADPAAKDPSLTGEAAAAQRELEAIPVRALETFEHPRYLRDALENSRVRLLIISPWIRCGVVDDAFVAGVEALLKQSVEVFVGWGISGAGGEVADSDPRARGALSQLATRYANFHFRYLGNTHAKVLLSDRRFVIVTSFNWLSYRGDPNRTFRDERGVLVAVSDEVDRQFGTLQQQFL